MGAAGATAAVLGLLVPRKDMADFDENVDEEFAGKVVLDSVGGVARQLCRPETPFFIALSIGRTSSSSALRLLF